MALKKYTKLALAAAMSALIMGCSSFGDRQKERLAYVERPAETIYNQAVDRMDRDDWERAKLFFQEVERQHPFSKWARRAMLMSAYAS